MACRTLAWFRNEIAVHHRFSRPFSGQYGPAFVAACAKLLQTGPTADSNQIQLQTDLLMLLALVLEGDCDVFGTLPPRRIIAFASSLLSWELKEEAKKKKKKSEDEGSIDIPSSHFAVSELLHHLLSTSVITASCLPSLPDSPLMEELAIEELITRSLTSTSRSQQRPGTAQVFGQY
ncbi:uncharacterized protein ACA1_375810 [Acanthamoeba castellanii str. Neff]|uniref:Uncharacterized protein n=1 Tax=Acanthamoeba castellanii (strain ATCC 30010 / Neff) TaxID=1257118 RepID=L8HF75_ACACF|nr:uncharacterized protein ACA1_375810 [Acanthamoeba castellanii str. Neff]ELR24144.1 hypothetical protein ACA1_375810 [Acanthamoeba castellanii str. Neff]